MSIGQVHVWDILLVLGSNFERWIPVAELDVQLDQAFGIANLNSSVRKSRRVTSDQPFEESRRPRLDT